MPVGAEGVERSRNGSSAKRSYYAGMIEAIMRSLPRGESDVPAEQTLEIVRIIEAANDSRQMDRPIKV